MPETNEPGLDQMMAALRLQASGVRGTLDVGPLAAAGRRRAQRRRLALGGALAGVFVMVLGGGAWGLATWADRQPDQTFVADSTSTPTAAAVAPVEVSVDTSSWPTYSSPQYPVTFRYPPDWTVGGETGGPAGPLDGCDSVSCVLFVSPPASASTASIELIRSGFSGSVAAGSAVRLPADVEVLGSVPGLAGWSLDGQDQDGPGQVVVVRSGDEWGVNYSLTVAGSRANGLALGDQNPQPDHPEAAFSFSTNVGNLGGRSGGEAMSTLVAILATVQPNPGYAPTQPTDDGTGRQVVSVYDAMTTPTLGTVTPDASWKTYTSTRGNVTVRYPSTWTVDDSAGGGVVWLVAPSGYTVDLLTNGSGSRQCDQDRGPSQVLGTVDQVPVPSDDGTWPAEVRWINGGEYPVWLGLTRADGSGCYLTGLAVGGVADVYLGSADNMANPTPEELDQAVAVLASARRAG